MSLLELESSILLQDRSDRRASIPPASGGRYNAESALDSLLDDLQEFRAKSAQPAPPASSELACHISCFCPRICVLSMLPIAPSSASVPVCHGYGHVALELVCQEPNHEVPSLLSMPPASHMPFCMGLLAQEPPYVCVTLRLSSAVWQCSNKANDCKTACH